MFERAATQAGAVPGGSGDNLGRPRVVGKGLARAASLLVSAGALLLGAGNVSANEWHYAWGASPVIQPSTPAPNNVAYGTCPYALPADAPANVAHVGVHQIDSWVELKRWNANLGYSPEAMTYYLCSNNQSASWESSPFYQFWTNMYPSTPANLPPFPFTTYSSSSPAYWCPSNRPNVVAAFCQTRALW